MLWRPLGLWGRFTYERRNISKAELGKKIGRLPPTHTTHQSKLSRQRRVCESQLQKTTSMNFKPLVGKKRIIYLK